MAGREGGREGLGGGWKRKEENKEQGGKNKEESSKELGVKNMVEEKGGK